MQPKRPIGKLKFLNCEVTHQDNSVAVYVDVLLKDKKGNIFKLKASNFVFDLIPFNHPKG